MADNQGRRMWPEDVARRMGVTPRTVRWFFYQANKHRRAGQPRPGDFPAEDGRAVRPVRSTLGWDIPVSSAWWWESTIEGWLARRPEARKEAWARPHGPHGEFVAADAEEVAV